VTFRLPRKSAQIAEKNRDLGLSGGQDYVGIFDGYCFQHPLREELPQKALPPLQLPEIAESGHAGGYDFRKFHLCS
jgi:hypothetical protein